MTIEIRSSVTGVLLPVKAQAGAKRNAIAGEHSGRLKVAVTAIAKKAKPKPPSLGHLQNGSKQFCLVAVAFQLLKTYFADKRNIGNALSYSPKNLG